MNEQASQLIDAWTWTVVWAFDEDADVTRPLDEYATAHLSVERVDGKPGLFELVEQTWTRDVEPQIKAGRRVSAIIASPQVGDWPGIAVKIPMDARPVCKYRRGIEVDMSGGEVPVQQPASLLYMGWERGHGKRTRGAYVLLAPDGSWGMTEDIDAVSVFA